MTREKVDSKCLAVSIGKKVRDEKEVEENETMKGNIEKEEAR